MTIMALTLTSLAAPLSQHRAQRIAWEFLSQATTSQLHQDQLAMAHCGARRVHGVAPTASAYYIFNAPQAWVIVAGDDSQPAVLGYGNKGNIDPHDMPPALASLLDHYAHMEAPMSLPSTAIQPVKPLIKSKWGQGAPFNILCPTIDDEATHAATGCVATAMAQLMYHYLWPREMTGVIPSYVANNLNLMLPEAYPDQFPQWFSMRDYYLSDVNDNGSQPSDIAVAQLMYLCGCALQTNYGTTSAARTASIIEAMPQYFKYAPTMKYVQRSYCTSHEWTQLLCDELAARRPVVYRAQKWNDTGHTFLCDGIDANGLVHVNWGCHGNGDGYYLLTELNTQLTDSDHDTTDDGWNYLAAMIVGIKPQRNDDEQFTNPGQLSFYNLTVAQPTYTRTGPSQPFEGVTVNGRFNNGTSWVDKYDLGFALCDQDNNIIKVVMETSLSTLYPNFGATRNWPLTLDSVDPGKYWLRAVSRVKGSDTWLQCMGSEANYALVDITPTLLTIAVCGNSTTSNYTVTQVTVSGPLQASRASTITATMTNEGTHQGDYIYLLLDGEATSVVPCNLAPGETANVVMHFTPAQAGQHVLQLALDHDGNKVIYTTHTHIVPATTNSLSLTLSKPANTRLGHTINDGTMATTLTINNTGTTPYDDMIVARVYRHTGDDEGVLHGAQAIHTSIDPTATSSVEIAFHHLAAGDKFRTSVAYYSQGQLTGTATTDWYTMLGDLEPGDVNGDHTIDINDINLTINILLGKTIKVDPQGRQDANQDGIVDINDINSLINRMLKKRND